MDKITLIKRLYGKYRITLWIVGFLLSATAMFLPWDLGREAASLLGGEPGIRARLSKGFVIGLVISCLQWPIVRPVGVLPIWFIVASGIGFAIGYPLGQTIQGILYFPMSLNWRLAYGGALVTFGLSLGMPQWLMIRRKINRANLWILFSVIGWILTGVAWIIFGVNSGEDAIAYGIVAGLGLVWLVHSQQRYAQTKLS